MKFQANDRVMPKGGDGKTLGTVLEWQGNDERGTLVQWDGDCSAYVNQTHHLQPAPAESK